MYLRPVHKITDIWFLPYSISRRVDVSLILSLDETCCRDKQPRFPYSYCYKMVTTTKVGTLTTTYV